MSQLRHREEELNSVDLRVKVVAFDDDVMAATYVKATKLAWPLLLDSGRQLYQAYGFERGSWWKIFSPRVVWKYLLLIMRGSPPGKPGSDWRQMGGDVLIDPNGMVRLHHASTTPHDRPSVDAILEAIR